MQDELERLRAENAHLRSLLNSRGHLQGSGHLADRDSENRNANVVSQCHAVTNTAGPSPVGWEPGPHDLTREQITRYSRQLILPSFGVEAQARLCKASVLIIGAGGLGCPAALYLAAAGVGRLGIADKDAVELSNLHRQIAHREEGVGSQKVDSAGQACRALNSSIQVDLYRDGFTAANALELAGSYDVVVDATDNAASRYLISDACAVLKKPLVSGAALGTDGQLTVYCCGPDGPCYRCLFPEAPQPRSCASCSDAGVLGVVPGIIGTLQALEAIKLASGKGRPLRRTMLLLDSLAGRFTSIKLRAKVDNCAACGRQPTITAASLPSYDYAGFVGAPPNDLAPAPLVLLPPEQRIGALQARQLMRLDQGMLLVDVRPREQFDIAHIPGSRSFPFNENQREAFQEQINSIRQLVVASTEGQQDGQAKSEHSAVSTPVCVVCRRGNDSQRAVQLLRESGVSGAVDVIGGLGAWSMEADADFPTY